jgi:NAD(P)-dependent dehydrogenase (short-subunit alcohol dehydrogenase family)
MDPIPLSRCLTHDDLPLGKITEAQFDEMIGTNLKGVLFAVPSAVPLMPSGGSIVLIGSTAFVAPPPGMSIYGAIKTGFHGLVRALVQDLATAITAVPLRITVRYRRPPPATAIGAGGTDSIGGRSREWHTSCTSRTGTTRRRNSTDHRRTDR